ncbi:hypothetical protein MnTg02_03231 [bacterium MnTg02]|nr:hypothetical protein MnTg02_03231 [bacterium MnTg02]
MHCDGLRFRVLLEINQQIVLIEIRFVAKADNRRHAHFRRAGEADDRHANAARLRRERRLALNVEGGAEGRAKIFRRIIETVNIRSHDAHAMFARNGDKFVLQFVLAHLAETRGDHNRASDAFLADLFHGRHAKFGGDRENGQIDAARYVENAFVDGLAENVFGLRMHGIDVAPIATIDEVLHHRVADFTILGRGADDRNGFGMKDPVHRRQDFFL